MKKPNNPAGLFANLAKGESYCLTGRSDQPGVIFAGLTEWESYCMEYAFLLGINGLEETWKDAEIADAKTMLAKHDTLVDWLAELRNVHPHLVEDSENASAEARQQ